MSEAKPENGNQADRLYNLLQEKFGLHGPWNYLITTSVRASDLYWIINLAEAGIKARKQQFKDDPHMSSIEALINLASWQVDVEKFVDQIKEFIDNPKRPNPKGN